ncbi:MAG: RIP metalloprotease RseP [Treponema sp.]|jgi:regulator of sigma E protease|nr:RIP metalloprotease RseP [Treponema sp.]
MIIILRIVLGIIGLGLVVFVHELGHFLAARLVGVDVEAFSLGWGKPILKKRIGAVEYRIGMFPVGGYCKMRGENGFQEAYAAHLTAVPPEPGTFYGVAPWRRIIISAAGPLFNILFAVLALAGVWGVGFSIQTLENKIVLASSIESKEYPADEAHLATGDRIVEIDGKPIETFRDIQENIAFNPEKTLPLTVERDGELHTLTIKPTLDKTTATGQIGVYYWADPIIAAVTPDSAAARAGLQSGDRILTVNDEPLLYTVALVPILEEHPLFLEITYRRNGEMYTANLPVSYTDTGAADLGIEFETITYKTPQLNPLSAFAKGVEESVRTAVISVKSLGLLFRGIDLTQAVSGPVRITYMVGDTATAAFSQGLHTGFVTVANFLALISISLCIMNLLPLPVLDGGLILLFIIEIINRKPLNPRAITLFQTVGIILIFGLMLFALFGDILYFVHGA